MSKLIDAAKRLSVAYTEDATPEELLARMETLELEQEQEHFDENYKTSGGHMSPQLAEAMNQYFEELCLEVKTEYGTDLHKIYMEV